MVICYGISLLHTDVLLFQAYGSQFVKKVKHRHVLARNYFTKIPDMADKMKSKVKALPLPRPKERVITVRGASVQDSPQSVSINAS